MSRVTDSTKKIITETALKMFIKDSISKVRLYDIAAKADVGEATIYRHFGNKQNVVIATAIELSNRISVNYLSDEENKTGFEAIKDFYEIYLKIFRDYNYYYAYLNELDSYLLHEDFEGRDKYQANLDIYKDIFRESYLKGIKDGTIRQIEDPETFYFSTVHAMTGLCKKLSTNKIVAQDEIVDKEKEIKTLINVFLGYLKK